MMLNSFPIYFLLPLDIFSTDSNFVKMVGLFDVIQSKLWYLDDYIVPAPSLCTIYHSCLLFTYTKPQTMMELLNNMVFQLSLSIATPILVYIWMLVKALEIRA